MVNTKFALPSYEGEGSSKNHPVNISLCTSFQKDELVVGSNETFRIVFRFIGGGGDVWIYPSKVQEIRDEDYSRIIKMFGC